MKKAIVLGGTFPHRHLIKKLKERGYQTILVDYYEDPIAKEVADRHIQASTLDKDAVLAIAQEEKVDLVITTCIDQANVTACYVAEKLGLPHPYSYQTALNVTDKTAMKRIMIENGIPTSRFYTIDKIEDFNETVLRYPIIVKPKDSNSSKGVRRIDKDESRKLDFIRDALAISRDGGALIEEFKEGREVGVDCFIKDGKAHIVMTKDRRKIYHDTGALQQIYGSLWPAKLSQEQLKEFNGIAEKIATAFELDNCPLMIQAIVSDDEINVIEFGARIGGGESARIIKEMTGFDYIDQSINSYLGHEIEIEQKPVEFVVQDNYLYTTGGVFGKMDFNEKCLTSIMFHNAYRKKGAEIGSGISSNNRAGVFVVKGKDKDEATRKTKEVLDNMEIYDIHGNPIMRREIY